MAQWPRFKLLMLALLMARPAGCGTSELSTPGRVRPADFRPCLCPARRLAAPSFTTGSGFQPINPRFQELTAQAAHLALVDYPDRISLPTRLARLRWFADSGDLDTLALVLDSSHTWIPAGIFTMGSDANHPDERPQRQVHLDAYAIDQYEVTTLQYQRFLQATGRRSPRYWSDDRYPPGQADAPVVGVSWVDAQAYCAAASACLRKPNGRNLPWDRSRQYPWGMPGIWSANLNTSSEPPQAGYLALWRSWLRLRQPGCPPCTR
jgi:hypothetical protein